jgi:UDP-N-acetyl-2-amino-2-deoxyglucuronate dehydrogenase
MNPRKVRFALVGCGRVSGNHLDALAGGGLPTELVAVCDVDEAKARAKAEKYGVPYHTDFREMMRRRPEIDAVCVTTPTGLHAKHVVALARYGKHIVVEKPMALRVKDAQRMIDACAKSGARLFVVKQNRFNAAVQAARGALESGRFGKIVMGTVRVRWKREQAYYEADDWHGTWAMDGGVMSQQASHHLDLLQWFLGDVESVQCATATRLLDIEVEDTAAAILRFRSGAIGIFEATVATRPDDLEASFSLLGEGGSVIVSGKAVNRLEQWRFVEPRPEDHGIQESHSVEVKSVYGHGHGPYLGNVAEAILSGKPALVEGAEGLRNVGILTALYESAARGGAVLPPGCRVLRSKLGRV